MNRKNFILTTVGAGSILAVPSFLSPVEKVKDFVGAGHNNLDKVKQLLQERMTL